MSIGMNAETTASPIALWIFHRVSLIRPDAVQVTLGGVSHVISREQAVALAGRLLQVGIGTDTHDQRAVCALIGDAICERRGLTS